MQINLPIKVIFNYAHGYNIDLRTIIQLKQVRIIVRSINKSPKYEEKVKEKNYIGILIGKNVEHSK